MSMTKIALSVCVVTLIAAVPLLHKVHRFRTVRNLRTVETGALYRSGQMSREGFDRAVRERDIRTVISVREGRNSSTSQTDEFEPQYCEAAGLKFHRLPQPNWEGTADGTPGEDVVRIFLNLLDNPEETPRPILIHCFAGEHRTGAMVAIYRMEYDGWRNDEAIEEMTSFGNLRTTYAKSLLMYLGNYTPQRRSAGGPAGKG